MQEAVLLRLEVPRPKAANPPDTAGARPSSVGKESAAQSSAAPASAAPLVAAAQMPTDPRKAAQQPSDPRNPPAVAGPPQRPQLAAQLIIPSDPRRAPAPKTTVIGPLSDCQ